MVSICRTNILYSTGFTYLLSVISNGEESESASKLKTL